MKRALLVALLLVVVGLFAWVRSQRDSEPANQAAADAGADADRYGASDVELLETDENGAPLYRLRAAELEQESRDRPLQLLRPELSYARNQGQPWQVRADRGTLSPRHDRVDLTGNVQATVSGIRNAPVTLRSSELAVDIPSQLISSDGAVTLEWRRVRLVMRGVRADLARNIISTGPGHGYQLR